MTTAPDLPEPFRSMAILLPAIRDEMVQILFNRFVFGTHQEIVRRNPRLQGRPQSIFCEWAQIVYGSATAIAVRRLASSSFEDNDVNLVKLIDALIHNAGPLWSQFERHFEADVIRVRDKIMAKNGKLAKGWEMSACKQLLGEDRKAVINAARAANHFASKRVAHSVPSDEVTATFFDLEKAVDTLKRITEKYTLVVMSLARAGLEPLDQAGYPASYDESVQWEKNNSDLLKEMKNRKLPNGWDSVFLIPWATPEILALPLGEMTPPD